VVTPETSLDAGTIYRMHVHQVVRWAARLGGPALDLEDTVHEVFAIVCRRLSSFRGESSLATWLFGITDKVARHRRRKERWWRWLSGSADRTAGHLAAAGPDPLRAVEQDQTARDVYRVLDRLSEGDRRILILFELEELATYEVAALLGIKAANARLRRHRARTRFLQVYQREFPASEANVTRLRCENVIR
jgi:RNA polymerase sigma-70 factor (ECF subfamily)